MMKHLAKAKGWLTGFLGKYTTSAPVTVINEILQLYSTYTKNAVEEFPQVEMQISTGYMDQLETFLSKFLCKYSGIYRTTQTIIMRGSKKNLKTLNCVCRRGGGLWHIFGNFLM